MLEAASRRKGTREANGVRATPRGARCQDLRATHGSFLLYQALVRNRIACVYGYILEDTPLDIDRIYLSTRYAKPCRQLHGYSESHGPHDLAWPRMPAAGSCVSRATPWIHLGVLAHIGVIMLGRGRASERLSKALSPERVLFLGRGCNWIQGAPATYKCLQAL